MNTLVQPTPATTTVSRAALAAAGGFLVLAGFEVALGLGAPLGRAAFGGQHDTLPTSLRVAAVAAAGFWTAATLPVLRRGGVALERPSFKTAHRLTRALTVLLSLGALMNMASRSNWERLLQAPFALTLAVLCFVVARHDANDVPR